MERTKIDPWFYCEAGCGKLKKMKHDFRIKRNTARSNWIRTCGVNACANKIKSISNKKFYSTGIRKGAQISIYKNKHMRNVKEA